VKALERLTKRRSGSGAVITPELARIITELSADIQRQVGLLLDRRGHISAVVVGDAHGLLLPDIQRRGRDRLCGQVRSQRRNRCPRGRGGRAEGHG